MVFASDGLRALLLSAQICSLMVLATSENIELATVEPGLLNPQITADWYAGNSCFVYITEPDFVFNCHGMGVLSMPRTQTYDDFT